MNGKYGASRGPWRAGALVVVTTAAMLIAGCGVVHISLGVGPAPVSSAAYRANLAYAHCMRSHGAPNFPIPSPGESFHISGHPPAHVHGRMARANQACEHLLPRGSVR